MQTQFVGTAGKVRMLRLNRVVLPIAYITNLISAWLANRPMSAAGAWKGIIDLVCAHGLPWSSLSSGILRARLRLLKTW
jgi:hypothetical protein